MKSRVKIVITLVALAVGVLPAVALAHAQGHSQNAPGHNKGSGSSSTTPPSPRSQAEKQCRQERAALGKSTFDQTYGTNKNGKNAFGKCVSQNARQQEHPSSGSGSTSG